MPEGIEENVTQSSVDAAPEANSDDAVLAQLEALINDDGTTAEPPATEDAVKDEPPEVEDENAADDDLPDEDKDEEDDAPDKDPDDDKEDEVPDEEEEESGDIELSEEQLVEVFGLDEGGVKISDEGGLQFKVKVDKEEQYVPLKDMVNSFQFESHLRKKSQKDAEERKEFQEVKTVETERLNKTLTDAVGLVSYLEQQLTTRYTPEQLNQLRATKPDEWAAVQQEIAQQSSTITNIKAGIQRTIQEQQQEAANQMESRKAAYVTEQTEKLYEYVPTWIDEKVAAKEYSAMKDAAIEMYGFTEGEMLKINDHRIIRLMLDAVKGSAVKSDSPLKKKLKKVPRIVKSGKTGVNKATVSKKRAEAKKLRIKSSGGDVHSIASALEDII